MTSTANDLRILILCAAVLIPGIVRAQSEDAVESGRRALSHDAANYPWYDKSNDDVRRIDVVSKKVTANDNRSSNWVRSSNRRGWSWNFSQGAASFWQILKVVIWSLVFLVVFGVIGIVVWVFMKMEWKAAAETESTGEEVDPSDVERVENLPFKVKKPQGDLLAEARRHYEAGNYRDAVIYLFSYKLVQLDKHQFIRLAKGKTNRQYLRELRGKSLITRLLKPTMYAFEDVFFGDHDLERREFESCWRGLDEFHGLVHEGGRS